LTNDLGFLKISNQKNQTFLLVINCQNSLNSTENSINFTIVKGEIKTNKNQKALRKVNFVVLKKTFFLLNLNEKFHIPFCLEKF
jgi:hypothetical protein